VLYPLLTHSVKANIADHKLQSNGPLYVGIGTLASECNRTSPWGTGLFHIINHVQPIGFLSKDHTKRQVRGSGANFTVLSVATQQSWKDSNDEWQSKTEWHRVVVICNWRSISS
jgi:hypothetical protein